MGRKRQINEDLRKKKDRKNNKESNSKLIRFPIKMLTTINESNKRKPLQLEDSTSSLDVQIIEFRHCICDKL
jgi:hypothetical protein